MFKVYTVKQDTDEKRTPLLRLDAAKYFLGAEMLPPVSNCSCEIETPRNQDLGAYPLVSCTRPNSPLKIRTSPVDLASRKGTKTTLAESLIVVPLVEKVLYLCDLIVPFS